MDQAAGTPGGVVLGPFSGAATTELAARELALLEAPGKRQEVQRPVHADAVPEQIGSEIPRGVAGAENGRRMGGANRAAMVAMACVAGVLMPDRWPPKVDPLFVM
ncbi:hypothetical protein [Amycolatopsis sp.]|uniref:hypothetical protein n=1 Tax=Amycolatopsis sp. TaxID=37632 RepID=UPI002B45B80E|nr:hypothetical protein [Amycolatopsis sp.]